MGEPLGETLEGQSLRIGQDVSARLNNDKSLGQPFRLPKEVSGGPVNIGKGAHPTYDSCLVPAVMS